MGFSAAPAFSFLWMSILEQRFFFKMFYIQRGLRNVTNGEKTLVKFNHNEKTFEFISYLQEVAASIVQSCDFETSATINLQASRGSRT